jgi:hypothetical protein
VHLQRQIKPQPPYAPQIETMDKKNKQTGLLDEEQICNQK